MSILQTATPAYSSVAERSASGLSVRAWCQENGVREKNYHCWQRKLRAKACQLAETQVQDGLVVRQSGFAEVRVAEPTLPKDPGQLCVEIGRMRLITDSSYPTDKLAVLLGALSRSYRTSMESECIWPAAGQTCGRALTA